MSSYQTALQNENLITRADDEIGDSAVRVARSDQQLVELVLSGDGSAFEQIFDRHKRMVAVVAGRYFRNPEQIEEIIQINLTTEERAALQRSAAAVQELVNVMGM